MFRFVTEKKQRPVTEPTDFGLLTPAKTASKQLFVDDKENNPKENQRGPEVEGLTPFSKRVKMNIEKAYCVSKEIIARISELEEQLEHTRNRMEEEKLDFEQVFDTPSRAERKEGSFRFEASDLKLESAQKIHRQSFYFSNMQKLKGYARRYFNFDQFANHQLKVFQKILMGDRVLLNGNYLSGKLSAYMVYIKLLVEEKRDLGEEASIVMVSRAQRFEKIQSALLLLNLKDSVQLIRCAEIDHWLSKHANEAPPLLVVSDSVGCAVKNLIRLKGLIEGFSSRPKFLAVGFYDQSELTLLADMLKLQRTSMIVSHGLATLKDKAKAPRISVSFDTHIGKSVMKFIREGVEADKSKKIKIRNRNHVDYVIMTKEKPLRDFITEFANHHAMKVCSAPRITQDAQIMIAASLEEVKCSYDHLFVVDFDFELDQFCKLTAYYGSNVHLFLSPAGYAAKRKALLSRLASPYQLNKIILSLQESELEASLALDAVGDSVDAASTEQLLKFLHLKGLLELKDVIAVKKFTVSTKNPCVLKEKLPQLPGLGPLIEASSSKHEHTLLVSLENLAEVQAVLLPLKKEGLLTYQEEAIETMLFSSKYRKINAMRLQFESLLRTHNEEVCKEVKRLDRFYALLKVKGYAHITRTKTTEKYGFNDLQSELEKIFLSSGSPSDEDAHLPFKCNYKKHDLIRDLCIIIKNNLPLVNEQYFSNMIVSENMTYQALLISIIREIFLEARPPLFKVDDAMAQRLRSFNALQVFDQLRGCFDTIKKELLN